MSFFGDSNIDWYCDECNTYLNDQAGFNTSSGRWTCSECGYENDVTEDNIFDSEDDYLISKNKLKCPDCGEALSGIEPDPKHCFYCQDCFGKFYYKDGEFSLLATTSSSDGLTCINCQNSLKGGEYTGAWENGNNPDAYVKCPHCGYVNFLFDD